MLHWWSFLKGRNMVSMLDPKLPSSTTNPLLMMPWFRCLHPYTSLKMEEKISSYEECGQKFIKKKSEQNFNIYYLLKVHIGWWFIECWDSRTKPNGFVFQIRFDNQLLFNSEKKIYISFNDLVIVSILLNLKGFPFLFAYGTSYNLIG